MRNIEVDIRKLAGVALAVVTVGTALMGVAVTENATHPRPAASVQADGDGATDDTNPWT
ncbi:hypothetical protein [Streptomyces chartreusis]